MNTFLLTLSGRNAAFLLSFLAVCVAYIVLHLVRSLLFKSANRNTMATHSKNVATEISARDAETQVYAIVENHRATNAKVEIINQFANGVILEIRGRSKANVAGSELLKLLRSIAGVESVSLGGYKSKGRGRRTPVTISVYFQNDSDGHHASLCLAEAVS